MARHELANIAEQRMLAAGITERQRFRQRIFFQHRRNSRMLQQRLDFRRKCEEPPVPVIVKRFDAHPVPRAEKLLLLGVPDAECEHSPKEVQAIRAVLFVGMQDGLGIGTSLVAMPGLFERGPQGRMVVNLAIERDPESAGFVGLCPIIHGLVAALDVDDAQPPLAQMRPGIVIEAKIVGAAMADRFRHSPQNPDAAVGRGYIHKSSDPAHNKECGIARFALALRER